MQIATMPLVLVYYQLVPLILVCGKWFRQKCHLDSLYLRLICVSWLKSV